MNQDTANEQLDAYTIAATAVMSSDAQPMGVDSLTTLGTSLMEEFNLAEVARRPTELRWLQDLRQFRGQYDPEILALIGAKRSKAFVRKTRVKVKTVDARCVDLLFPADATRNWNIETKPIPSLAPEQKADIEKTLTQALGRKPSADELADACVQMAANAAKEMLKTIEDQLADVGYKKVAKQVIHSGNLFGTGILKAPLVERKIRERFVKEGNKWVLKTETYTVPFVDFVPLWRFFPDMVATELKDCRFVYERHLMTKFALAQLAEKKSFDSRKIQEYILSNPEGQLRPRFYDNELKIIGERIATQSQKNGLYEVFERWGWLDGEKLVAAGVQVPQNRLHESFFSNIWMLPNGVIIKAVLQPINGVTWPYHLYYFDKDETNIFGEGLAAIMRDDQTMLNAATRMILDNAAITAGPQMEVNMRLMARNEKAEEMFPFKIWPRTGEDANAPAVRVLDIPSKIGELQGIAGMFADNADEVTAIPKYLYGENATAGAAGTASGMSMLMGAASIVMKDLVLSYDQVTEGFIKGLYRWNMQFNPNQKIKGDFDIVASGSASMMAKELRAQQLDQFAQMCANPLDEPYIKRDVLLRQRAEAHELHGVVKTEDEVNKEANSPAAQAQAAMQQLQMKNMELMVANLQAKIEKMASEAALSQANMLNKKMMAAYAAMEAAGIAVGNPGAAAAGDALLRAAGWTDAPGSEGGDGPIPPAPPGQPPAEMQGQQNRVPLPHPDAGHVGMMKGIETASLTDGQPNG